MMMIQTREDLEREIAALEALAAGLNDTLGDPDEDKDIPVSAISTMAQVIDLKDRRDARRARALELERAPRVSHPGLSIDQEIERDRTVCELSALLREQNEDSRRIDALFGHHEATARENVQLREFFRAVNAVLPEQCRLALEADADRRQIEELSEQVVELTAECQQLRQAKMGDRPDQQARQQIIGASLAAIDRLQKDGWKFSTGTGPQPPRAMTNGRIADSAEVQAVNSYHHLASDTLLAHAKAAITQAKEKSGIQ